MTDAPAEARRERRLERIQAVHGERGVRHYKALTDLYQRHLSEFVK